LCSGRAVTSGSLDEELTHEIACESHPHTDQLDQLVAQNITQISGQYKFPAPFSLIYRSAFIAPVRLIIVMLCIAHQ